MIKKISHKFENPTSLEKLLSIDKIKEEIKSELARLGIIIIKNTFIESPLFTTIPTKRNCASPSHFWHQDRPKIAENYLCISPQNSAKKQTVLKSPMLITLKEDYLSITDKILHFEYSNTEKRINLSKVILSQMTTSDTEDIVDFFGKIFTGKRYFEEKIIKQKNFIRSEIELITNQQQELLDKNHEITNTLQEENKIILHDWKKHPTSTIIFNNKDFFHRGQLYDKRSTSLYQTVL